MERLTKENPNWLNEEFWVSAEEPDDERIDDVYLRLKQYEDTGLTPEDVVELKELLKLAVKSAKNNHSCGIVGCSSCSNYYDCGDINNKIGDCENWQWKCADRLERLGAE